MRRGLGFTALFLLVVGLEMATEALSLVISRLGAGLGAVLSGGEAHVSQFRFVTGTAAILSGLVLLTLLLWSGRRRHDVASVGTACPQCGERTRRVKRREWQRVLSTLMGERLTRRRCDKCGWTGLSLTH